VPSGAVDVHSVKLVECEYLVDNSALSSDASALSYRNSPVMEDRAANIPGALYGSKVHGVVVIGAHNDEWLKVGMLFLPTKVGGSIVLCKVQAQTDQCLDQRSQVRTQAVEKYYIGDRQTSALSQRSSKFLSKSTDLSFMERHVASQEEMLDLFGDTIRQQGQLVRKTKPCLARSAVIGERVLTKVGARCIADLTVRELGMVIKAPSAGAEEYF